MVSSEELEEESPMQEVFTLSEAQALQGHQLFTTQDFKDEFDRLLIPATSVCRVIGLDAWADHDAVIAIQWADDGVFPKVVLVNKTTYDQHFEDVSVQPVEAD
jgi:hypothetical protein